MFSRWTVGRQFMVGLILLAMMVGTFVFLTRVRVQTFSGAAALVATSQKTLRQLERVLASFKDADAAHRDYLTSGSAASAESFQQAKNALEAEFTALSVSPDAEQQKRLKSLQDLVAQEATRMSESLEARRAQGSVDSPSASNAQSRQRLERVRDAVTKARDEEEKLLSKNELRQEEELSAFGTFFWFDGLGILVVIVVTALLIGRTLERKLQTAIAQVQNSSAELHSAASQQVTGAREQASATTEISTTVKELLSTSRQIASSAQQVSRVADETAGAARQGNDTVQRSQEAIDAVRRQVDAVVTHMLELGKRSQEIGGILDIINELSEQTNILAINATIESAGAGEHGRRFAVVAEEIRKLADRVGGATKDIRALIDEIRAASNTTIMATEDGSKAVQSSAKQFSEVAGSFRRISELVRTNLDVVREIELSTQQQTTAVEQVNIAILEVAQTAQQSEVSSSTTLQTANRLSQLSQQLTAILDSRASA
ncbi:HAMP domain-containing methyl-accepting chemotaxis protein [Melittangium boletus]|uniref:Chemotaxis protein n=1 Tax=Melittangium boletus DSM 14713 TaxID=1294270 RepID=A0A250IPV7_9BACT|nr:methyl-accepting chemotaxis protein [Melittangium boletus]ATB33270.1 chemotaxis protein [Melittangium boletus DSM 14713]